MPDKLPQYFELLRARFPDYEGDAIVIASIGMKINGHPVGSDDHAAVVINQCRVAWEILNSIHCLAGYDYGLAAMSLCRNLFELVAGTVFLIENPDSLQDFLDYGKTVAYELAEAIGADQGYLAAFKQKADYDRLKKRFGREKWHRKSIKGLAEAVSMQKLYDSFYKEASSIAHGDSFVTLGFHSGCWQLSKDVRSWTHYCETSLEFSFLLIANLYHRAVHKLKLPYVTETQAVMGRLSQRGFLSF